jgi:hypothetical protein
VLNLPKAYGLILDHLKAATTAVVTWWVRMSDADKRQTRQRVLTIVSCAGVFALGGPLIAQRFGDQKAQEAYRADAIVLAQSIATENEVDGQSPVHLVSFTNRISPEALLEQAASAAVISTDDLDVSVRSRDSFALRGLVGFTLENLGNGRNEQDEIDCLAEAVYFEARSETRVWPDGRRRSGHEPGREPALPEDGVRRGLSGPVPRHGLPVHLHLRWLAGAQAAWRSVGSRQGRGACT